MTATMRTMGLSLLVMTGVAQAQSGETTISGYTLAPTATFGETIGVGDLSRDGLTLDLGDGSLSTDEVADVTPLEESEVDDFLYEYTFGYTAEQVTQLRTALQEVYPGQYGRAWGCAAYTKMAGGSSNTPVGTVTTIGSPNWPPCPNNTKLGDGSLWRKSGACTATC